MRCVGANRHGAHTDGAPLSLSSFQKEDFSKKLLTLKAQIWYTGRWFQKRRRILTGRFFVFSEPVNKKPKQNMDREKRKTHLMYSLIRFKTLASCVLVCFAFLPQMHAAPNALPTPFPGTNPDGCYPGFTTAEGCNALAGLTSGAGNTGIGWYSLSFAAGSSFSTGVGAGSLVLNHADSNTAVGAAAMLLNTTGHENTAVGVDAMVYNDSGEFNGAVGGFALFNNTDGFSNNAMGDSALFQNIHAAQNTAVGDLALSNNDVSGNGDGNNNTAVGAQALVNNGDGSENTAVGTGAGTNVVDGFNNTYVGDFVGTDADDEDSTIRIGDLSNGNGAGSLQCYIGGIFNNHQPRSATVAVVTINLTNDHLGWDTIASAGGAQAPLRVPQRAVPAPRGRLQPAAHAEHQAMLNKKVEKLQATVTLQQRQIEALTTQLKEQAAQIQKVNAQLEMIRPAPQMVENR